MSRPLVTVLLAVRNGREFLAQAVASIQDQTLEDFELLVVDDASTDQAVEDLAALAEPRLRVLRNERHLGLAASLNRGLDQARGRFVARMDADDLALPGRLAAQVARLEAEPDLAVCGSWHETFGGAGSRLWKAPAGHERICCEMLLRNPLSHPTVMFRAEALAAHGLRYDPGFACSQDYDLFHRAMSRVRLGNVQEALLRYREHAGNVSLVHRQRQAEGAARVRAAQLAALGLPDLGPDGEHERIAALDLAPGGFPRACAWLERLREANAGRGLYPEPQFSEMLCGYLLSLLRRQPDPEALFALARRSPLLPFARETYADVLEQVLAAAGTEV